MNNNYTNNNKVGWNSSELFLERMERRWENADIAKATGDTIAYFRALETIFRNSHPFFSKDEVEQCEEFVKKIEGYLAASGDRASKSAGLWVGENQCDKFRMLLVGLLFKYQVTYVKAQKPKTWEELIEEDFQ